MGLLSNWLLRCEFDWCHIKMFNFAGIKCRFKSSCPGSPLVFSMSGFNRLQYEIMWIMKALLSKQHIWSSCAKNVIYKLYYSACRTPALHVLGSHEIRQVAQASRSLEGLTKGLLHWSADWYVAAHAVGQWWPSQSLITHPWLWEYWLFTDQPCVKVQRSLLCTSLKAAVVSDGSCVHCSISMSATSNSCPNLCSSKTNNSYKK